MTNIANIDRAVENISIIETSRNVWRISVDGKALDFSRGYDKPRAWAEATAIVERDHGWAVRDNRPIEKVLRPAPPARF